MTNRWLLLVVALLGCPREPSPAAKASPPPDAGTITFGHTALAVGSRFEVTQETELTLPRGEGAADLKTTSLVRYTAEVLAAQGSEVVKARLSMRDVTNGGEPVTPSSVANKTYLIEWSASQATVVAIDGGTVSAPDAQLLRAAADLLRPNEVELALARGAPTNVDLPEVARAFSTMYSRREEAKAEGVTTRVEQINTRLELRNEVPTVVLDAKVVDRDRTLTMYTLMKGALEVDRTTGLLRSMLLEGTVDLDATGKLRTGGHMKETVTVRLVPPL